MVDMNGVIVGDKGEVQQLPEGYPPFPSNGSIWGIKVVVIEGEKRWEPATEEDFINSEMKRLGAPRETVLEHATLRNSLTNPCHRTGTASCEGECPNPNTFCAYSWNPGPGHSYCVCRF
jgi:hypothetical protein